MIRRATLSDAEAIASIYNYYVKQGTSTMDSLKTKEDIKEWLQTYTNREGVYVLDENNQIKGWAILKKYSDRYGYRFACESSIYVEKNSLRQGIGDRLNVFIIQKAKDKDFRHMTAKIFAQNTASISFFKKYGYQIVGKQHKIGYLNNQWIDMVIMEKIIE